MDASKIPFRIPPGTAPTGPSRASSSGSWPPALTNGEGDRHPITLRCRRRYLPRRSLYLLGDPSSSILGHPTSRRLPEQPDGIPRKQSPSPSRSRRHVKLTSRAWPNRRGKTGGPRARQVRPYASGGLTPCFNLLQRGPRFLALVDVGLRDKQVRPRYRSLPRTIHVVRPPSGGLGLAVTSMESISRSDFTSMTKCVPSFSTAMRSGL